MRKNAFFKYLFGIFEVKMKKRMRRTGEENNNNKEQFHQQQQQQNKANSNTDCLAWHVCVRVFVIFFFIFFLARLLFENFTYYFVVVFFLLLSCSLPSNFFCYIFNAVVARSPVCLV